MERVYLGFFCICLSLCTVVAFLVFLVYVLLLILYCLLHLMQNKVHI